jgi:hypothetical protein
LQVSFSPTKKAKLPSIEIGKKRLSLSSAFAYPILSMENPVLDQWAERLLDLGRKNRLLNFTASRFSSLNVLAPSAEVIFAKLPNSNEGMKVIDIAKAYEGLPLPNEESIRSAYEKKANSAQILFFHPEVAPSKVLKALSRKAASALQEQGTSILYLAFGFVTYTDIRDHLSYRAPLLLLPVALEGGTPLKGYVIKAASDDVEVNPTFAYYCQSYLKLTLPDYDNSDLPSYFAKLAPLCAEVGWSLESQAVALSTFSFEKMSMYLDLKNHQETILKNPIITQILGISKTSQSAFDPLDEPQSLDDIAFHNVFSADASQLSAIRYAKEGKSFVLQGPPGTGKSQSITNIIAEALHDHKKVLFVSEKLAALNVVYNNLKRASLTDFALELHSDKSDKQLIFSELAKSLYAYKTSLSNEEKDDIDELIATRKELDFYAKAIHDPTAFGEKSVYELITLYESLASVTSLSYITEGIEKKDIAYFKASGALLERYEGYSKFFGYDYRKAELKDLILPSLSYEQRNHLLFEYSEALKALSALEPLLLKEKELLQTPSRRLRSLTAFIDFALQSKDLGIDDSLLYQPASRNEIVLAIKKLQQKAAGLEKRRASLAGKTAFKESNEDLKRLLEEERHGYGVFGLFSKERKANALRLNANVPAGKKREEKVQLLEEELAYEKDEKAYRDELEISLALFGGQLAGLKTDFAHLLDVTSLYETAQKEGVFAKNFTPAKAMEEFHHDLASLALDCNQQATILRQAFTTFAPLYPQDHLPLEEQDFSFLKERFDLAFRHGEDFESWSQALAMLAEVKAQGLTPFLDAYLDKALPLNLLSKSYQKDFVIQEIYFQLSLSASLQSFSHLERTNLIEKFKNLDELQYRISRNQIAERLSEGRPSALNASADPNGRENPP